MKKQVMIALATLLALGIIIATIVPLVLPANHEPRTAHLLALGLSPIGVIGAIIAFFVAKPKPTASQPRPQP